MSLLSNYKAVRLAVFISLSAITSIVSGQFSVTNPSESTIWALGQSGALIQWIAGDFSTTDVKIELYRNSSSVSTLSSSTANDGSFSWNVPTNLATGSGYRIKISSSCIGCSVGYSDYFHIEPAAASPPEVTTRPSTGIAATSAYLNGRVDPNGALTSWHFEYGLTTLYGKTSFVDNLSGTSEVSVSAYVSDLDPAKTYHYRIVASNTAGNDAGDDMTFTTTTSQPGAVTNAATNITTTTARLNATIEPHGYSTEVRFEYGLTTSYDFATSLQNVGASTGSVTAFADVPNLMPGRTYHFRVVANSYGGQTTGNDLTFNTQSLPTASLTINIKNIDGSGSPLPGNEGRVRLFNSNGTMVGTELSTNEDGAVTFYNVPTGTGYYYEVYHDPVNTTTPFGREYWGKRINLTVPVSEPEIFIRDQPYGDLIQIYNGEQNVTGQTVQAGTPLTIRYTMYNPKNVAQYAKGNVLLDRDDIYPYDLSVWGSERILIPANSYEVQQMSFTPQYTGPYHAAGGVDISEIGDAVYTDGGKWSSMPIMDVTNSSSQSSLLSALTILANSRGIISDGFGGLADQYAKNLKNLGFISYGVVEIFFDLDDYYSAMFPNQYITEEGKEGWITIWINGKLGIGADVLPVGVGLAPPLTFTPPENDPKKSWELTLLSANLPFLYTSVIEYNNSGFDWGIVETAPQANIGFDIIELGVNVIRFEIKKEVLDQLFNYAFNPSGSLSGLLDVEEIIEAGGDLINSLSDFSGEQIIPSTLLSLSSYRRFSSSDSDQTGVDGVINFLNGGIDINSDGIRDNYYPVMPITFLGLPFGGYQAELAFQNTGFETADFYIKAKNVPNGWYIGADDGGWSPLVDNRFDFEGIDPTSWNNSIRFSNWAIACLDDAPEEAVVTFELWHKRSLFESDVLLQDKTVTLHKFVDDSNTRPSIQILNPSSNISAYINTNLDIVWDDIDPDDDAELSIAIDPDINDLPWEGQQNHIWIAKGMKEDPDGEGDKFTWEISGIQPGLYKLWLVIYDGRNLPYYISSSFNISVEVSNDITLPSIIINSASSLWFKSNPTINIDFYDNSALNDVNYQIDSNIDSDPGSWQYLTSDGINILEGSQSNSVTNLTTDWKISTEDWNNLTFSAQNGGKHHIYFKVTDDAGNVYITPDQASAFEFGKDDVPPNVSFNTPNEGESFSSNLVTVTWSADDNVAGLTLSGIDFIYLSLDDANNLIQLPSDVRSFTFDELQSGSHTVYLKAIDKAGNESSLRVLHFSLNLQSVLELTSGNNQSGIVSSMLTQPFVVSVEDAMGNDVEGVEIIFEIFSVPAGATGQNLSVTSASTNSNGQAVTNLALGNIPGQYIVRASSVGLSGSPVTFTSTAVSNPVIPGLTTAAVSSITSTSAICGGTITSDGGSAIISKGVCWSTSPDPTINDSKTSDGSGIEGFTSNITGLTPGLTYHVRAYAENSAGPGYGNDVTFTTQSESPDLTAQDNYVLTTIMTGLKIVERIKSGTMSLTVNLVKMLTDNYSSCTQTGDFIVYDKTAQSLDPTPFATYPSGLTGDRLPANLQIRFAWKADGTIYMGAIGTDDEILATIADGADGSAGCFLGERTLFEGFALYSELGNLQAASLVTGITSLDDLRTADFFNAMTSKIFNRFTKPIFRVFSAVAMQANPYTSLSPEYAVWCPYPGLATGTGTRSFNIAYTNSTNSYVLAVANNDNRNSSYIRLDGSVVAQRSSWERNYYRRVAVLPGSVEIGTTIAWAHGAPRFCMAVVCDEVNISNLTQVPSGGISNNRYPVILDIPVYVPSSSSQTLNLAIGWNTLSLAVQPPEMSLGTILEPLITSAVLVKVQDEKGKAVERLSNGWINEIGQMSVSEGYKIRVTENTLLNITGQPVTLPYNIQLESGWNIIGYPSMNPQTASTVFGSLIASGALIKVQNEIGQAIEQIGGTWTYGFANLNPGEGYKVQTSTGATLTIAGGAKGEVPEEERVKRETEHFRPQYMGNGLDHMNIYLGMGEEGLRTQDARLREGNEIGVFDGDICVGSAVVENEGKYIQVIASLDDPETVEKDGFTEGNTIVLRLWNRESGEETVLRDIEPVEGYSLAYERQGTTVLKTKLADELMSSLGDAYPNPSRDKTTFTFGLAGESRVRLEIIDVVGNTVAIVVDETMQGGIHRVEWDNTTDSGARVRKGMYLYKMLINNQIQQTKQIVLL